MEKQSESNQNPVNSKNKNISSKVTSLINETLANPWENFWDRIDYIINKVISSIDPESIKDDELTQKKVFDEVCDFLNNLFKEIHIKKFYNTIPKTDLNSYAKKNLWNQMISNIYWKERKLFYKKEVNWWSCHYRSVFLKKIFDILKSKWFNIQDRIFLYDKNRHSGVIIKFQWETYLADYWLFNQMFDRVISPITLLNGIYQDGKNDKFSFTKKMDFWLKYFDETKDFIENINSKKLDSFWIEFNPRLNDWKEHNIRIRIYKKHITFRLNGEEKKYFFEKNFNLSKVCKNSHETLDCLLWWLIAKKSEKQELKIYFDMIRDKINPQKVQEILS